jgi:hypothetical protein
MPAPATRVIAPLAGAAVLALALSACTSNAEITVGSTTFSTSAELAAAMSKAGVACTDVKLVQQTEKLSMSTCTNPDFTSLNIVVFHDPAALAQLVNQAAARDGKEVTATTTIYGNNWATIGSAKDAATVSTAAEKLGATLATAG